MRENSDYLKSGGQAAHLKSCFAIGIEWNIVMRLFEYTDSRFTEIGKGMYEVEERADL